MVVFGVVYNSSRVLCSLPPAVFVVSKILNAADDSDEDNPFTEEASVIDGSGNACNDDVFFLRSVSTLAVSEELNRRSPKAFFVIFRGLVRSISVVAIGSPLPISVPEEQLCNQQSK